MRTLLFLFAGFLLQAAFLVLARLFSGNVPAATTWATTAYIVIWFAVATTNMWIGVSKAGYSVLEELPILLLIFGLPAAVAVVIKWKVL